MSSENKANSLTDFAELVLGLNTKERLALLTKHYVEKEPKLTDVFSPQVSESRESVRSRKTSGNFLRRNFIFVAYIYVLGHLSQTE